MGDTAETSEAVARTEEDLTPEEIAEIMAEEVPHQPAPPPTPVRSRYYLTECEHCGWIGSSEHLGVCDDDISCPVCCQSICGDEPDEADTAKHGEAVYQRIITAEAEVSRLTAALAESERQGAVMREALAKTKTQPALKAPTWDEAVTLALRAIHDTDGRGMIARNRNHLHERVAREIFNATRALTLKEPTHEH